MEAITFTAKTKKLELVQSPVPKVVRSDDVLIKVAYSGICGTDLHIIQGEFPCHPTKTFTLGHEFSGTVVDVGSDVFIVKPGDKVSVDPNDGCKCCNFCRSGNPHYCRIGGINNTIGIYRDGGWAQYCVAPACQVHKLPDTISLEQAALTEPISCLAHGWDIISPVTVGKKILVIGAGVIGSLWVCTLHLHGHRNVTVSEPNQIRLNMLKNLNTGYNLITPDQLRKNQQEDPDYLFDLRGGTLCCFGVAPPHGEVKIKPFDIYMKEMKIFGVNINPFSFPKSIGLLEAMGERYLNYDKLGIKTFPLKQHQEAIELLKKGTIAKAIFKL